jgi:hypothetical protein
MNLARQSRAASLGEAATNVIIGYLVALGAQQLIFPLFGIQATMAEHSAIAAAFTIVSLSRSYLLRRLFERLAHIRRLDEQRRLHRLQRRLETGMP